ncbi:MAG: MBL fold metallo-hydrolase [Ardenticatenaceae bacterium]|nr:MBL fold metallo-hydrolase [Anaerolineales bacterium]MCB8921467.1 MBL fold metallo-hydrolase [Ardenticatenaceae bacterium]MCB9004941.1 MBL fold metallo-hydrolase [Ardenticatenaceae bacterium]
MAREIASGVYWIDGDGSNFYLCVEEDGLTLIDSGMPRREGLVWELIASLGRPRTDLKRIVITHADLDHAGSVAALQAESGATVYAGEETAVLLPTGKSPKHLPLLMHLLTKLIHYKPVPAKVIEVFRDGDDLPILGGLQVLATPGHTTDHFSLYHPSTGVLFTGDALNHRDDTLQMTPPRITADLDAARQSALRLLAISPAVFACGHGTPLATHTSDDVMRLFNELRGEGNGR